MKKNRFLATLIGCFYLLAAQAQKEGNVWHFGHGAALDFNSGTAVVTTPSSMQTFEGCASIADANGNLLFYTNGGGRDPVLSGQSSGKIWNRNHQVLYDMGNTEGGGFSAAQSSVIIPRPGVPNHYYLFTMEEIEYYVGGAVPSQPQGRGLSYFDVDMGLTGGLGGVASYTGMILTPSYEGLCAVRHTNGSDAWIVVHNDTLGLAVFPVNTAGVGTPILYNLPGGTSGIIKGSPNGKWLTINQVLYQFDATTGSVSNPLLLAANINFAEFSPNSKRLFVISASEEVQYFDLTNPDIAGSKITVTQVSSLGTIIGQMQLAPDGKIYFVQNDFFADSIYLSTIVCPNTAPFVELKKIAFSAADDQIFFGLPNFDNAIFRRDVDPPLPVNLGTDQTLCGNQNIVLDAGINNATYIWSNGASSQTIPVESPGTYAVTVTAAGCGVGADTIVVNQLSLNLNAGSDRSICIGESVQLDATGNGLLAWTPAAVVSNPTSATPLFTGTSTTTLVLTATLDGCTAQDSLTITVSPTPNVTAAPSDTTILAGAAVQITGTGTGTAIWSPAAGLSCSDCLNPLATPTETTTYTLVVTNAAGCSATANVTITVTPPDCSPKLPNAFTPNGDTVNDDFKPVGDAIESYDLTIYNRWGQEVFKGNTAWDGRLDNQDAPSDVYVYRMSVRVCGNVQAFSGDITLVR